MLQSQELEILEEYEGVDDDDYVLVINADGKLKSFILPEEYVFNPPKKIRQIMKLYGIKDLDNLNGTCTLQ